MHAADCAHCHTEPADGNHRFLVKNATTRESRHVLAPDSDAAIRATGWTDVLFTMLVQIGVASVDPINRVVTRERFAAMHAEREESLRELHNDRALNGVANSSSRLADEQKKEEASMAKKKTKTPKSTRGKGGSILVFDLPVTSVIRWMGGDGFDFHEVKAALAAAGVSRMPSDNTIRSQIGAGKTGERGALAKLTAEQQKILRDAAKQQAEKAETEAKAA